MKKLSTLLLCILVAFTLFLPKPSYAQEPFMPKDDSTVGDVMRHFDREEFEALPDDIKATLDSKSLKDFEKENTTFSKTNDTDEDTTVLFTQQFEPASNMLYSRYGFPLNPLVLGTCHLTTSIISNQIGYDVLYSCNRVLPEIRLSMMVRDMSTGAYVGFDVGDSSNLSYATMAGSIDNLRPDTNYLIVVSSIVVLPPYTVGPTSGSGSKIVKTPKY